MSAHVHPRNDLIEHVIDDPNDDCPCGPTPLFENGDWVIVHHSLDGRENQ